jgi:hypothetical protein
MNRGGDRVQKPGIGIGRGIDRQGRPGCDGAGNLDIQHYLAIRPV